MGTSVTVTDLVVFTNLVVVPAGSSAMASSPDTPLIVSTAIWTLAFGLLHTDGDVPG